MPHDRERIQELTDEAVQASMALERELSLVHADTVGITARIEALVDVRVDLALARKGL